MAVRRPYCDARQERRCVSYQGNYTARSYRHARRAVAPKFRGSDKCGYKWPFCAPNGENRQNRGGGMIKKSGWNHERRRRSGLGCWVDTRQHQTYEKGGRFQGGVLHWARGAYGWRKRQRKKRPLPSKRHARRKGRPVDLPSSLRNWPKRWGHLLLRT